MKSINLFLTSRQMSLEKKLRLDEDISGKSLLDLPPEILANILRQTYDFPMLFNLCRINHKFNEFIHSHFKNIGVVEVRKYLDMDKSVHTPRTRSLPRSRTFREIMYQIVIVRCHTLSGIISYDKFSLALFGQLLSVLKMCVHMESFEVLHAMVWCSGREAYQFNKLFTIGFTHLKHLKLNWHKYTNRKLELSGCTMLKSLNWCGNSIGLKVISFPSWIKDLTLVDLTVDSLYILPNLLVPVAMNLEQLSLINIHVFGSTSNSNHDTHGQLVYLKLPKLKQLHLSSVYYHIAEVKIMLDLCDSGNIERIEVALLRSQYFEIINFNLSNCPNLVTFDYDDGGDNGLQLELPFFPTKWNNLKELTGCAQSNFDLVLEIVNNSPRLEFVNLNGSCDVTVYGLATLVAAVYHNYNGQFKFVKVYPS